MANNINCFKRGTLVISEKPFACVLSSAERKQRCDHCFKRDKVSRCSGCKYVSYCDRVCQREAWRVHKFECANLKKILPKIAPDGTRLMARVIAKLQRGGRDELAYCGDAHYRSFKDLMSHRTQIKQDEKAMRQFVGICAMLPELLEGTRIPDIPELLDIYGKIHINSFDILDAYFCSLGTGIYLAASKFDHSCKPNAAALFDGTTVLVRLLEDIPSLDWSKITISYIDIIDPTQRRREILYAHYYFWCHCPRCEESEPSEEAMACVNKSCSYPCSPHARTCEQCHAEFPESAEETYNEILQFTQYQLNNMQNVAYIDVSKFCLKRQAGVLHPLNLYHVQTLANAVLASRKNKAWEDAEVFAQNAIQAYLHYHGEMHPVTGLAYLLLVDVKTALNKTVDAVEVLKKAYPILKMTFGEEHSLMREKVKPLLAWASLAEKCLGLKI